MISKIYNNSPIFIQNILISLYGYYWKNRRYGGKFLDEVKKFEERESFSKEDWNSYQTDQLRKLLVHAFLNVDFYRKKYSEAGFTLQDFERFELSDIKKLPFLEKEELRKFGKTSLLSKTKEQGKFYSSSGSSGTPTQIYFSPKTHRRWHAAYERRVRNWAGVNYQTPRGMIGGRRIISNSGKSKHYYRYNKAERQTYFSAYHINEDNVHDYLEGMIKNEVEYMVGYAQSNYFLADFIGRLGLKAPKLRAVLTSSEKLTPEMRETFRKVYKCKAFDAYSGLEACGLISENMDGEFLFSPDTGLIELVDEKGHEVSNGQEGEVISTGFLNYDQPLIRYRIGDRAIMSEDQTTKSGIEMPVFKEIVGRIEDTIVTKDGRKMVRFHSLFLNIKGLKASQIIQEDLSRYIINLVTDEEEYSTLSEESIKKRLVSQVGEDIEIRFTYMSKIPNQLNGKFKSVVSKLSS